jgi:hypothetical protein
MIIHLKLINLLSRCDNKPLQHHKQPIA